ncbi:2-dehydro-3-deoxyphosphogluconate aldolase / (4S)-4-hydroxy-2-oxoglutarate aldolase [Haloechinothrix alba]|uniref:2-dehydro-3-deoxy-phosphogluconate aldolase n=1 Tax=Haloechinothrix alba TaxID=664784 RepID=A0A238Z5V6_9PSEU|nr:bifunctional 4-hydroxy-2-oxoglutarate aldolase/2-dehydro-3-deoxy-phosphogluconate aldolase [Haloechinothrix alba]SNR78194.1 2-dehydro-3-deoxyphosphogluconate aldolase / (4S)-4-hydroxy-2-oxoglutarate aldolase [Haloechinothrix alba]
MSAPVTGSVLDISPVIPVVVLGDAGEAAPLAGALSRGGIGIIEVTLRSPAALEGVGRIRAEVPEITVGVGTVTSAAQVGEAVDAGAQFLVSPGSTPALLDAMTACPVPYLAGTSTVSEMLEVLDRGATEMKFFPAEASGGLDYLKSVAGPLPHARFCPTGGISADNAPRYLAAANVGCVGGSWLTPADAVTAGNWQRIERLAAEAAQLG